MIDLRITIDDERELKLKEMQSEDGAIDLTAYATKAVNDHIDGTWSARNTVSRNILAQFRGLSTGRKQTLAAQLSEEAANSK